MTLAHAFRTTVSEHPDRVAVRTKDDEIAWTWGELAERVDALAGALARDERVRAAVQQGVDDANATLARVEQIKKFTLVAADWMPGGDELTPTMKLKRKRIAAKYADEISAMY